jgi:glycosyltransferase involved in cell wall biosynthesis
MKKPVIHQFHSGSAYGDAVTNAMLFIQNMLTKFGFESQVYVERVAPELKSRLNSYKKLALDDKDVILIHHSMGHDLDDFVTGLPGKKILVYHNITPAEFFADNERFRHYAAKGREQLKRFRPYMAACICDSRLNAAELLEIGYENVWELPLLTALDNLPSKPWDSNVVHDAAETLTLLFVGRISPNKCQEDLIAIARILRIMLDQPFQLVLVGGYSRLDTYFRKLAALVKAEGLEKQVRFMGKVPDAQLYGWYRAADIFVCMSAHEGFGVPLIEAMAFDVPVIAYKSSSVPDTLGKAGIRVARKDPKAVAALISILVRDRAMKRALIEDQRRRVADFSTPVLETRFFRFLTDQGIFVPNPPDPEFFSGSPPLSYQVEGPFETSYSLALVNRETALALDRKYPGRVGLFATEGPGDYAPDPTAVRAFPGLESLWQRGEKSSRADVVIRNLYPPRVADMDGQINLLSFAWEESMLPAAWVDSFNRHLDGLAVTSRFVKKTLIDNGISLPVAVVGNGVDHMKQVSPEPVTLTPDTGFTFLHVSSGFPRKGMDLLLEVFVQTFTKKDDTKLVIKTFPNAHNTVDQQILDLMHRYPDAPPIQVINQDLSPSQMAFLYTACHALVAPSRGEGFGLPMAEAMAYGMPVITTGYGGQSDFCTPDSAWLIDFSFAQAQTHLGLFDSVWAAPDPIHLGRLMKQVRHAGQKDLKPRLDAAKQLINTRFSWDRCISRIQGLEEHIRRIPPLSQNKRRVAWISSWNTRCGIATYSRFLLENLGSEGFELVILASKKHTTDPLPDTVSVRHCWTDRTGDIQDLLAAVETENPDVLVIQFNFAFFTPGQLEQIILAGKHKNRVVIVFFHATQDVDLPGQQASLKPVVNTLARADRLLVHSISDLNRLKSWGLCDNTTLFPHGVIARRPKTATAGRKITLATYGFLLPHKGLEQLITAFADLKKRFKHLHLLMVNALYPDPMSNAALDRCQNLIQQYRLQNDVTLVTEFLADEKSLSLLESAHLIVFPYQDTSESASGAVRYGLASHRPVACTPLDIFQDVRDMVHFLPGTGPDKLADGLGRLLKNPDLMTQKTQIQAQWLAAHDWRIVGKRLAGMIRGLSHHDI